MRLLVQTRRAGVPAVAVILGLLAAGPAHAGAVPAARPGLAGVTVSPAVAEQGSGQNLTFHVTNTGTRAVGTIRLVLPGDTPVAEVYPLSVDDWAPRIDMRTLRTPLPALHGGTPVTETAGAITWLAMPGRALAPGRSADLSVAMGPMPSVSSLRFTVATTDPDGQPGPPPQPVSLTLTPPAGAPAGAPVAHAGHGEGPAAAVVAAATAETADSRRGSWSVAGWVVAVLAVATAAALGRHGRRGGSPARVGLARVGLARVGRWTYRG